MLAAFGVQVGGTRVQDLGFGSVSGYKTKRRHPLSSHCLLCQPGNVFFYPDPDPNHTPLVLTHLFRCLDKGGEYDGCGDLTTLTCPAHPEVFFSEVGSRIFRPAKGSTA